MELSFFLARFWGSLFIILGLGSFLVNFLGRVIKYTDNHVITVTTGYLTFLLGLITVVLHNVWVTDLRLAITLIGWTTLLKGIEKIMLPDRVNKVALKFKGGQRFWGLVIFAIGIFYFWLSMNFQ